MGARSQITFWIDFFRQVFLREGRTNLSMEPKSQNHPRAVEMSARAREYFLNYFAAKYKELQAEANATPLSVLIWGPGESGGDLYEKRVQIRSLLREQGYAAVFSEEVDLELPASPGMSSKMRELLQAQAADFIIVLQASPGSTAEVHDFANVLNGIGAKMLIFIDSRFVEGYSYTGALHELTTLYRNVETYKYPEDITECHLSAAVTRRLSVLRWAKWHMELSR